MQCSSCGTLLPPGVSTCPNCGAPVVASPQPTLTREPEKTPSFYDEYIPFTDPGIGSTLPSPPSPIASTPPPGASGNDLSMHPETAAGGLHPVPDSDPGNLSPSSRRSPLLILTTATSLLSLLVIIVLVFLLIRSGANNAPTQTAVNQFATSDPLAIYTQVTNQKPQVNDAFSGTSGGSWSTTSGNCVVSGVSLHATAAQGGSILCGSRALAVSNFACQVEILLTQGNTAGLIFRADQTTQRAYIVEITSEGTYILGAGQSGTTNFNVLAEGSNSAINAGHGIFNLLTIIARGDSTYFYVNKHFIVSVSDHSSTSGLIGVVGGGTITNVAVDLTFNHLQLWKL